MTPVKVAIVAFAALAVATSALAQNAPAECDFSQIDRQRWALAQRMISAGDPFHEGADILRELSATCERHRQQAAREKTAPNNPGAPGLGRQTAGSGYAFDLPTYRVLIGNKYNCASARGTFASKCKPDEWCTVRGILRHQGTLREICPACPADVADTPWFWIE